MGVAGNELSTTDATDPPQQAYPHAATEVYTKTPMTYLTRGSKGGEHDAWLKGR